MPDGVPLQLDDRGKLNTFCQRVRVERIGKNWMLQPGIFFPQGYALLQQHQLLGARFERRLDAIAALKLALDSEQSPDSAAWLQLARPRRNTQGPGFARHPDGRYLTQGGEVAHWPGQWVTRDGRWRLLGQSYGWVWEAQTSEDQSWARKAGVTEQSFRTKREAVQAMASALQVRDR